MTASSGNTTPAFLAACHNKPGTHTPVWIMRQAGRYLPEYRKIREKADFQTMTTTPDLAAEVTLQPIRRFGLDAAILFSDIMTPLQGMGMAVEFTPGPVVSAPIRAPGDVGRVTPLNPEESVPYVLDTVRAVRGELATNTPLIGFAGAPFTLFCYLVQGGGSKNFMEAKAFLYSEPTAAKELLDKLADSMAAYLEAQAEAGAQALMLFDSWVGILGPEEFSRYAMPAAERTLASLQRLDVPLIYFPNQGATLLRHVAKASADVIGVDWRLSLADARALLGPGKAVQGNLDPAALFAPPVQLKRHIDRVLGEAGPGPGHVFNLGHGIEPNTDPGAVQLLVDYVHERTAAAGSGGD
jgi:uroporphyrinogen decarboxylase